MSPSLDSTLVPLSFKSPLDVIVMPPCAVTALPVSTVVAVTNALRPCESPLLTIRVAGSLPSALFVVASMLLVDAPPDASMPPARRVLLAASKFTLPSVEVTAMLPAAASSLVPSNRRSFLLVMLTLPPVALMLPITASDRVSWLAAILALPHFLLFSLSTLDVLPSLPFTSAFQFCPFMELT